MIPQGDNATHLSKSNIAFHMGHVSGFTHSGEHSCSAVVLHYFLITPAEEHLIAIVGNRRGFQLSGTKS